MSAAGIAAARYGSSTGDNERVQREASKSIATRDFSEYESFVVHVRKAATFDVYIGRQCSNLPRPQGSTGQDSCEWGNPFKMKRISKKSPHYERMELEERWRVITLYSQWLRNKPELLDKARNELKGKTLACWCSPKPCHGLVLAEIANCPDSDVSTSRTLPPDRLRSFLTSIARGGNASIEALSSYFANEKKAIFFSLDDTLEAETDTVNDPLKISKITTAGILCREGNLVGLKLLLKHTVGEKTSSQNANTQVKTHLTIDLNKGRGTSTPLFLAAAYGRAACVEALIRSNRVNVNACRRDGVSALCIACQQGYKDVVKALCKYPRLQVNKRTLFPERVTPCLLAVRNKNESILSLLLAHPRFDLEENKYGGSKSGQSAIQVAEKLGHNEIAGMLRAHRKSMQTAVIEYESREGVREERACKLKQQSNCDPSHQESKAIYESSAIHLLTQRVARLEAENRGLKEQILEIHRRLDNM